MDKRIKMEFMGIKVPNMKEKILLTIRKQGKVKADKKEIKKHNKKHKIN